MFSNFKDTFIKKPQYTSEPPQAVIDSISQKLPQGFHYISGQDGLCVIDAPDELVIQSTKIQLSEEGKAALPSDCTMDDIMKYSYNAQEPIVFLPDENGCYVINGKSIPAGDLLKAPMRDTSIINTGLCMVPLPFPEPFDLEISGGGYTQKLHMKRIPNKSVSIEKFESDESSPMKISYAIDPTKQLPFTFNISLNMKSRRSAAEVVAAYHIYNAFVDGNGCIGGNRLFTQATSSHTKIPVEIIELTEKLLKLENLLKVHFNVSKEITSADARIVDELYRSFIEQAPFKVFRTFDTLRGKDSPIDSEEQKNYVGIPMAFEFMEKKRILLLDVAMDLYTDHCIFDAVITSFSQEKDKEAEDFVVHLGTVPGKRMYESVQHFRTEEELMEFQKDQNHLPNLEKATEI